MQKTLWTQDQHTSADYQLPCKVASMSQLVVSARPCTGCPGPRKDQAAIPLQHPSTSHSCATLVYTTINRHTSTTLTPQVCLHTHALSATTESDNETSNPRVGALNSLTDDPLSTLVVCGPSRASSMLSEPCVQAQWRGGGTPEQSTNTPVVTAGTADWCGCLALWWCLCCSVAHPVLTWRWWRPTGMPDLHSQPCGPMHTQGQLWRQVQMRCVK